MIMERCTLSPFTPFDSSKIVMQEGYGQRKHVLQGEQKEALLIYTVWSYVLLISQSKE